MARREGRWNTLVVRSGLDRVPADLGAVVLLVLLADIAAIAPIIRDTPLRFFLGIPFALFLPGYAAVAVLYPERSEDRVPSPADEVTDGGPEYGRVDSETRSIDMPSSSSISAYERVVLSVAVSVVIVPLLAYGFNFTSIGIQFVPVLAAVSVVTLLMAQVAMYRRLAVDDDRRFRVPLGTWLGATWTELRSPDDRVDFSLNVALVVVTLLLISTVAVAVVLEPQSQERYTEAYLAVEDGATGELVASDYPTSFALGRGQSMVLVLENHEGRPVSYTVIVELQEVTTVDGTLSVVDSRRLLELRSQMADDQTVRIPHRIVPTMTGDRLRVQYQIYHGPAPADAAEDNAEQTLHIWVNVTE